MLYSHNSFRNIRELIMDHHHFRNYKNHDYCVILLDCIGNPIPFYIIGEEYEQMYIWYTSPKHVQAVTNNSYTRNMEKTTQLLYWGE